MNLFKSVPMFALLLSFSMLFPAAGFLQAADSPSPVIVKGTELVKGRSLRSIRPILSVISEHSQCDQKAGPQLSYYDRLLEDGKLDISIGFGYMKEIDLYKWDPNSPRFSDSIRYQEVLAYLAQNFKLDEGKIDKNGQYHLLQFKFQKDDESKPVDVNVKFFHSSLSPSQKEGLEGKKLKKKAGLYSANAKGLFLDSLGSDDIVVYYGHSRHGWRLDFGPKSLRETPGSITLGSFQLFSIDSDSIHWAFKIPFFKGEAFDKPIFIPEKYQILSLLSCDTEAYYRKVLTEKARKFSGKDNSSLDIITFEDVMYTEKLEFLLADFISAFLMQLCPDQINAVMNYHELHLTEYLEEVRSTSTKLKGAVTKFKKELKDRPDILNDKVGSALDTIIDHLQNNFKKDLNAMFAPELTRRNGENRIAYSNGRLSPDDLALYKPVYFKNSGKPLAESMQTLKALNRSIDGVLESMTSDQRKIYNELMAELKKLKKFTGLIEHGSMMLRTDGPMSRKPFIVTEGLFDDNL